MREHFILGRRPVGAREAAFRIGISVNTLKAIPPSELPYFRVGTRGDRRYEPSAVEAYKLRRREDR